MIPKTVYCQASVENRIELRSHILVLFLEIKFNGMDMMPDKLLLGMLQRCNCILIRFLLFKRLFHTHPWLARFYPLIHSLHPRSFSHRCKTSSKSYLQIKWVWKTMMADGSINYEMRETISFSELQR